ncbi:3-beta hydroxysteroid dehydrogenase [Nocardioides sp. Root1257]|uniref:SDR family oxidoreductase n=1 Tax=unclassified Nocardioides TaxID=2615069 RepID=UPI0006F39CAE|nr:MULTISPECIES: SDR family oxidoreductase [unclassified Nocardioides]KQW53491.1 3-beta hydroxysteroid dehydrogenase [Nocardioides sp. Root1257]KRC56177.1 3-beta hydroxysteroid dehydrogenase [Nocardioides sp. Root224]
MRVFVTGASGFVGSAVVPELLTAGHQVVGLARSDEAAATVASLGAEVVRGSLADLDVLRASAADADAVVHLAFRHDIAFTGDFAGAAASDHAAIEAMGDALAGSGKALSIASGTGLLAPGRLATEADQPANVGHVAARGANSALTLSLADRGVRSSVVRLTPTVHDAGDNGFMRAVVATARTAGVSAYVGDGAQRWPAVHRQDAARLFRLAIEQAPAGSVLHAVGEEGVPLKDVAELIGRHLDLPVRSITADDAPEHFGFLAGFLSADMPASSAATRELLGWEPTGIGLLDDMAAHYLD